MIRGGGKVDQFIVTSKVESIMSDQGSGGLESRAPGRCGKMKGSGAPTQAAVEGVGRERQGEVEHPET